MRGGMRNSPGRRSRALRRDPGPSCELDGTACMRVAETNAAVSSRCLSWLLAISAVWGTACSSVDPFPRLHQAPPAVLWPSCLTSVEDGRGRFREIYTRIREDHGSQLADDRPVAEALWQMANEPGPTGREVALGDTRSSTRVVVVPGIFGECVGRLVIPFSHALGHLEEHGYRGYVIPVGGRTSSHYNAKQICDALIDMEIRPGEETVIIIAYSKGTPDVLEALVNHEEVRECVTAVVSVAGVVSGTPLADRVTDPLLETVAKLPLSECPPGTGGVESLSRSTRLSWLSRNPLPDNIRYFSVAGFCEPEDVSSILLPSYETLASMDPLNDSQVIFSDAIIPNSTLLGFVRADHWAIALPFARSNRGGVRAIADTLIEKNAFPREVFLEAVVRFVEESLLDSSSAEVGREDAEGS